MKVYTKEDVVKAGDYVLKKMVKSLKNKQLDNFKFKEVVSKWWAFPKIQKDIASFLEEVRKYVIEEILTYGFSEDFFERRERARVHVQIMHGKSKPSKPKIKIEED